MPEHRSHHRAEPEPPRRTAKDYAWIGAAITALGTMLGGHAYDRGTNLDHSERMHRSTLKYNAEERSSLDFRLKLVEWKYKELRREFRRLRRSMRGGESTSEGVGANMSMGEDATPLMPDPRHSREPPRTRGGGDPYEKLMQHVDDGRVYQPKGYGH